MLFEFHLINTMSEIASHSPQKVHVPKSRLRAQGFPSLYRKTLFSALSLLLVAYLVFAPAPWHFHPGVVSACQVCGMLLLFAGIVGRSFATLSIGGHKDRRIVNTELYSICRNPLYFSSFLMALGVGLLSARLDFLLLVAAGFLAIFYPMMRNEARYLRERFEDYVEYEMSVPLFFPNFRLWKQRASFEINFKLVKRTLLDSLVVLAVIPVMVFLGTR